MRVAPSGKADDVGEQDRDLVEATRKHRIGRLELGYRLCRKDCVQELIGALPLALDLGKVHLFLVAQALALEAGTYACAQQYRVEWLRQIIRSAEFNAADDAVELGRGRDHDDGNVPPLGVRLEPRENL